jgi:hypothetical protein
MIREFAPFAYYAFASPHDSSRTQARQDRLLPSDELHTGRPPRMSR